MADLATKFEGFESMMKQVLDKITGLETWRSTAEEATGRLLAQSDRMAERLLRLETTTPPPPPPPPPRPFTAPPQPPSRWINLFDLNVAPQQEMRPSASTWERPHGHRIANHHRDDGACSVESHAQTGVP
ncbi:zinc-finger homeodomain protein 10-like [Panicum virgatum]|uniref:zinc-finger homeodomain protein 10-like n=1 Tax=Panicum virgatum TaxID=38727 RepID=UPI0019D579CB|nr:zinc-finger homeodomain protein 10-like [Panicum virgatum]